MQLLRGFLNLFGQHGLAGFRLIVFLVIPLGVHGGRDRGIQTDGDGSVIFLIIILDRDDGRALFDPVQVRLQEIALDPQFFAVGGLFEIRLLQIDFAGKAVDRIGQKPVEIGGLCPHPRQTVALGVECVQQSGVGIEAPDSQRAAVLADIRKAEIHR